MGPRTLLSGMFVLLFCLLPAGCSGDAGVPAESSVLPSGSAQPTPEPDTAPPDVLPWTVPEAAGAPSYEDYFAQVREYGYGSADYNAVRGVAVGECYTADWADGVLSVFHEPEHALQWTVAELEDFQVLLCQPDWIYGVLNGTELVRIDYYGRTTEVLFTDASGAVARHNEPLWLADGKVLYFWAGAPEGGLGAYRLYLPEKRTDLLRTMTQDELEPLWFSGYAGTERQETAWHLSGLSPVSNQEFVWTEDDPAFYELYAQLLSDPAAFERYFAPASGEEGMFAALGEITRDYRLTPWTSCYCHAAEGVCLKKGYSAYSIHIGRTPWWKET